MDVGSLSSWFERPILIHEFDWGESTTHSSSIHPVDLLFSHSPVKNKLYGYRLIRFNLHLKFVINASPFHYGMLMAAFQHLGTTTRNQPTTLTQPNVTGPDCYFAAGTDGFKMAISTLPHVTMFPQQSEGAEMSLPFIWPADFMKLSSASTDYKEFGTLYFELFGDLQVASAATGFSTKVITYAWLTDVELSGPSIVTQSGMSPVIRPYAYTFKQQIAAIKACNDLWLEPQVLVEEQSASSYLSAGSKLLGAASSVFRSVGLTNHPNQAPVAEVRLTPLPQMASAEISTPTEILMYSGESGVKYTPEAFPPVDELAIDYIAGKEAYVKKGTWSTSMAISDPIFTGYVTPENCYIESVTGLRGGTTAAVQMTPACHISSLFNKWKGTLRYRFVFVSSQFHRGRVRLAYDATLIPLAADFVEGVTFSKVIDLAEATDVTIDIPFFAPTALLELSRWYASGAGEVIGTTSLPSYDYDADFLNGGWSMTVLNPLIGPVGASSIDVHCFVSCPDLILADPWEPTTNSASYFDHYNTQSLVAPLPEKKQQTTMIPAPYRPVNFSEYVGEEILSLRTVFHRTTTYVPVNITPWGSNTPAGTIPDFDFTLIWPRRPLSFGPVRPKSTHDDGEITSIGNGKGFLHRTSQLAAPALKYYFYNYVRTSPVAWMTPCYLGQRGSYNYKFVMQNTYDPNINLNTHTVPHVKMLTVSRSHDSDRKATGMVGETLSATTSSGVASHDLKLSMGSHVGSAVGSVTAGAALEVQIPFISKYKFGITSVDPTLSAHDLDASRDSMHIQARLGAAGARTYDVGLRSYVSTGADFNLFGYLYPPTVFYLTGAAVVPSASIVY